MMSKINRVLLKREVDAVVCYTDGVTEEIDSQGEEFGEDRLFACLTACDSDSSADLIIGCSEQFANSPATRHSATTSRCWSSDACDRPLSLAWSLPLDSPAARRSRCARNASRACTA
jgi:hypothetical protein